MNSKLFVSVTRANIDNSAPTYQGRIECREKTARGNRKLWVKRTGQRMARLCPDHAMQDAISYAKDLLDQSQGAIADIIIN